MPSSTRKEALPANIDTNTLDLMEYIQGQGFGASDIALMGLIADPEVTCTTRKQYQIKLKAAHGIDLNYERVQELMRDPKFQRCVSMIYAVEEDHMLRAVWKNIYRRAAHPEDPHAVAAANLLFKAKGILTKKEDSPGGGDANTYSEFLKQFRKAQKEGRRVTVRERTVTIDGPAQEVLPETGSQSDTVVEGSFSSEPGRSEDQDPAEAVEEDRDPDH